MLREPEAYEVIPGPWEEDLQLIQRRLVEIAEVYSLIIIKKDALAGRPPEEPFDFAFVLPWVRYGCCVVVDGRRSRDGGGFFFLRVCADTLLSPRRSVL
jgi:hypothetical protein